MTIGLQCALSDPYLDSQQASSQRQLAISLEAIAAPGGSHAALNLGLVLDHSGSMHGPPLAIVKEAAQRLVDQLTPNDAIAVVVFDHQAKVLVPWQEVTDPKSIKDKISTLRPSGGTAIDEGMKLGIQQSAQGRQQRVSQLFLLTDGENEHGDNDRCLKLAQVATDYGLTLNALGFGDHWNQDVLEAIADAGGGTLCYIPSPETAVTEFNRLLTRAQSVGLTNAHLRLTLMPGVRLAELKPMAQVAPETVELSPITEGSSVVVRLGDLMVDQPRVVLTNLYIGAQGEGTFPIAQVQVSYDDPALNQEGSLSEMVTVSAVAQSTYQGHPDAQVQRHVLSLAKYRQTQIAEQKLQAGDRAGAATLLQTAAKTALQMGDTGAATVLQENATRLQGGEDLSAGDRKRTRIASKTTLQ